MAVALSAHFDLIEFPIYEYLFHLCLNPKRVAIHDHDIGVFASLEAAQPLAEADRLRTMVGLTGDGNDDTSELTVETVAEIHQVLDQASEAFADEVRRSVDYYHTQEHDGLISKLVITGDGSLTRNIAAYLSQALHLPVETGNALQEVGENKSKLSEAELEAVAPRLTIAIGLALDDEE